MFGQQAEQGFYIYTDMVVDGMAVNGGITKVAGEDMARANSTILYRDLADGKGSPSLCWWNNPL